jgi:hypothetical protein
MARIALVADARQSPPVTQRKLNDIPKRERTVRFTAESFLDRLESARKRFEAWATGFEGKASRVNDGVP